MPSLLILPQQILPRHIGIKMESFTLHLLMKIVKFRRITKKQFGAELGQAQPQLAKLFSSSDLLSGLRGWD